MRAMLNRLSIRLFITILLVNILISSVIYFSVAHSIDRGFLDYIKRGQRHQIVTIVNILSKRWEQQQSWDWLDTQDAWSHVLRDSIGGSHGTFFDPSRAPDSDTQFIPPLADPRQFVLFDAQGVRIQGRHHPPPDMRRVPIIVDGETVGQLGYSTPHHLSSTLDRFFLTNQLRNLAIILFALFPASLILAGWIALWLGRRARMMALATQSLTSGDYRVRLPTHGQDELSRFSSDINTLARTLEQNRAARQRWGADIAHELRTPLAILKGELEAMQDGVRPMNADNLRSLLQEVELLSRLVNDLRLLAQTDSHRLDAPFERLDIGYLLNTQLEDRRAATLNEGFELNVDIEQGVFIQGARYRLRQLWRNLLDNSIAYTDAPGSIRVTLKQKNGYAEVHWEDSSPGVPDAALERLTERLFRLDPSRNRKSGGNGLGLSIAQALVQMHDGTMEPRHSDLGGLCWVIKFPLCSTQSGKR
ncbi:Signal transduction histidine-protein kinase BaeS [Halomonadaceae bacterium LMG 33818]